MNGTMPAPSAATPAVGPSALTPSAQPGIEAQALIKVRQAVMLLADAVGVLKTKLDGDLGKAILSSLKTLAPLTPGVEEGLGQSELASLLSGLQPVRNAPPGATRGMLGVPAPRPMVMGGPPMAGSPPPMR